MDERVEGWMREGLYEKGNHPYWHRRLITMGGLKGG